jgi:hypothetical protein
MSLIHEYHMDSLFDGVGHIFLDRQQTDYGGTLANPIQKFFAQIQ